jgi:hypothetical protein
MTSFIPRVITGPRRVITRTFNTYATILRKASVSDGEGGTTDTFAETYLNVPCSLTRSSVRPQEREAAALVEGIQLWVITFAYGTDVLRTDRILCDGRQFEVLGAGSGSYELAHRVTCLEIT